MTERHVLTSAAVSDDVAAPADPRARELRLLLLLAILAALPRVMWPLMSVLTTMLSSSQIASSYMLLRIVAIAIDVAAIVLIVKLAPLDAVVKESGPRRTLLVKLSILELVLTLLPIYALLYTYIGSWAFTLGYGIPSLIVLLVFARWLGTFLIAAGKKPVLVPVAVAAFALSLASRLVVDVFNPAFNPAILSAILSVVVAAVVAVEIMRVQRTLQASSYSSYSS